MDLTALTDVEFDAHCIAVQTERERRRRLADTPSQVGDLARRFLADGGEVTAIQEAIDSALAGA